MKLLESVRLVQFFLYESEDFKTGSVTGFFGLNGAGKSALLDAVQIALFGANSKLVSLNSKADETSRSIRTLRSYCLGQTSPDVASRVRDTATTYITLVWRDTVTQEPLSMGVCLTASYDRPGHEVEGRYLLPGAELMLTDHLDIVDGEPRPAQWPVFRERLTRRVTTSGESPLVPDAERFIKKALFALRPHNLVIEEDAFKRALKFGLRMRFDKASVDEVIRGQVLEARPTDIAEFRKTSETFRDLLRLFNEVNSKIADAEKIDTEYAKADTDFRRAMVWQALAKDVEHEKRTDEFNAAETRWDQAQDALVAAQELLAGLQAKNERLVSDQAAVDAAMRSHSAHTTAGTANEKLTVAAQVVVQEQAAVGRLHRQMLSTVDGVLGLAKSVVNRIWLAGGDAPVLLAPDVVTTLQQARNSLSAAQEELDQARAVIQAARDMQATQGAQARLRDADEKSQLAVMEVFEALAPVEAGLTKALAHAKEALDERRADLDRAQQSMDRVNKGRAPLSPVVQRLQSALEAAGLHPMPVCDLVKVRDATWQPVIESYLGLNREALMLATQEEEAAGFDVYRATRGIYGAKLFGKHRQKPREPLPDSVAAQITGPDPAAVAFIRSKFGSLKQAESREEALGQHALTRDGMLDSGTEFTRLEPVSPHDLKLGGLAMNAAQKLSLDERVKACRRAVEDAEWLHTQLEGAIRLMRTLGGEEVFTEALQGAWGRAGRAVSDVVLSQQMLSQSADESYVRLVQQDKELRGALNTLRSTLDQAIKSVGSATTAERTAQAEVERLTTVVAATRAARDAARDVEGFDVSYAGESWDKLLAQCGNDYAAMAEECRKAAGRRDNAANASLRLAQGDLQTFLTKYREHSPVDAALEWRGAWAWLQAVLTRLRDTELHKHEQEMQRAYESARNTFRNDVAVKLGDNLKRMEKYLRTLNQALDTCPPFTNGERYRFRYRVKPEYASLLQFVQDVQDGLVDEDLFGGPGEVPEAFKALLEDKALTDTALTANPLDDYRYFYEFDVEIRRVSGHEAEDDPKRLIGLLSSRLRSGSGGEHTAPLYVIAGAALAAAYRLQATEPQKAGMGLMLIDEAFLRMDDNNIAATMQYLVDLGLQVFVAGTGGNLPILTPFLHRYYDMARDEQTNTVFIGGHDVTVEARQMAQADLLEFHPDLVEAELVRLQSMHGVPA